MKLLAKLEDIPMDERPPFDDPHALWRQIEVVSTWEQGLCQALAPWLREKTVAAGEVLVKEGEEARYLFFLCEGELEELKQDVVSQREHRIDCHQGGWLGELALLDGGRRVGTLRAVSMLRLVQIDWAGLRACDDASSREVYRRLLEVVTGVLVRRAREYAADGLAHAKHSVAAGNFLLHVLVLVCCYSFLLSGLPRISRWVAASTSYVSIPVQLMFFAGGLRFMRRSGYPLSRYGLSFKHLGWSLVEAVVFTLPMLVLFTGMKWLVLWGQNLSGTMPLVAFPDVVARFQEPRVQFLFSVYALTCLVQEFIVRGALQSGLKMFLTGPKAKWGSILVAALLFSMTHLHMSFLFASLAFLPGVFWGWLFERRPNLAGVTLSHCLVGGYVFFVLGVKL